MAEKLDSVFEKREKRVKKREIYLKAKASYEQYLEKRKAELGALLLKIDENIGDYDDKTLKPYFEKLARELSKDYKDANK